MDNVVKKYSISSEFAQKMVNAAVAKAREIGVSENVAILDDGAISRPLAGWMGPQSPPLRWRRTRRIQPCSASPRRSLFRPRWSIQYLPIWMPGQHVSLRISRSAHSHAVHFTL